MTTTRLPILSLTWAGFEAAVDLIAAQCCWRDRAGLYGHDPVGRFLAYALADCVGLNVLQATGPGMVEIHGVVRSWKPPAEALEIETWAWVDATPEQMVPSVMKVTPGTVIALPWQDAGACCRRPFMTGFDD